MAQLDVGCFKTICIHRIVQFSARTIVNVTMYAIYYDLMETPCMLSISNRIELLQPLFLKQC